MTAKEYLEQVYYLDSRIRSNLQELADLRKMVYSVSSPSLEQSYNPNRPTEAPFVRGIESMDILERQIKAETDSLFRFKEGIRTAINTVENHDEQMVLRYRYIHKMTWKQIGAKMGVNEKTARRWHDSALSKVSSLRGRNPAEAFSMPENRRCVPKCQESRKDRVLIRTVRN